MSDIEERLRNMMHEPFNIFNYPKQLFAGAILIPAIISYFTLFSDPLTIVLKKQNTTIQSQEQTIQEYQHKELSLETKIEATSEQKDSLQKKITLLEHAKLIKRNVSKTTIKVFNDHIRFNLIKAEGKTYRNLCMPLDFEKNGGVPYEQNIAEAINYLNKKGMFLPSASLTLSMLAELVKNKQVPKVRDILEQYGDYKHLTNTFINWNDELLINYPGIKGSVQGAKKLVTHRIRTYKNTGSLKQGVSIGESRSLGESFVLSDSKREELIREGVVQYNAGRIPDSSSSYVYCLYPDEYTSVKELMSKFINLDSLEKIADYLGERVSITVPGKYIYTHHDKCFRVAYDIEPIICLVTVGGDFINARNPTGLNAVFRGVYYE